MEQVRIFCYTGTGNCLAAAKQIAKAFDDCVVEFITDEIATEDTTIACGICILVYPSYAYGVPVLVKRFVKKARFSVDYLALVCTYGSSPRGTNAEVVNLLKRQRQPVHYASGTQSVENYVHLFGHPKAAYQKTRQDKQSENIDAICAAIARRETNKIPLFRPLSACISFIFRCARIFFPKFYKIKQTCNGCEVCRRVCPTNAITMQTKRRKGQEVSIPRFKARKCDHCQACMQLCPQKSIHYFRLRPSSPRYLHRDVSVKELIKRD